jgi:hypothetical protein
MVDWAKRPPHNFFTVDQYPPEGPFQVVGFMSCETWLCSCGVRNSDPAHERSVSCEKGEPLYLGMHHDEVQIMKDGQIIENLFRDYGAAWWPVAHFVVSKELAA